MPRLTVRNLDEGVVARLKARARANERSLEAELRVILRAASGELPGLHETQESYEPEKSTRQRP